MVASSVSTECIDEVQDTVTIAEMDPPIPPYPPLCHQATTAAPSPPATLTPQPISHAPATAYLDDAPSNVRLTQIALRRFLRMGNTMGVDFQQQLENSLPLVVDQRDRLAIRFSSSKVWLDSTMVSAILQAAISGVAAHFSTMQLDEHTYSFSVPSKATDIVLSPTNPAGSSSCLYPQILRTPLQHAHPCIRCSTSRTTWDSLSRMICSLCTSFPQTPTIGRLLFNSA